MRRVTLQSPFAAGMVTDAPDYLIGPQNSTFAQDGFSPNGVFIQRNGWEYDGTTADVAANLISVYRTKFALADVTQTITSDAAGEVWLHNAAGAGTQILTTTNVQFLARCVYGDQLVLCAQDGETPARFYSGNESEQSITLTSFQFTTGEATIDGGTASTKDYTGNYWKLIPSTADADRVAIEPRILFFEDTGDVFTIEGIRAASTVTIDTSHSGGGATEVGLAFPCVSVYSAGTATVSSSTATGYGTEWATDASWGGWATGEGMALLIIDPDDGEGHIGTIKTSSSDTSMTVFLADVATKSSAHLMRRCPFKDAASHKESLWGTGVLQYPNRVYVSPPGWNPAFPPGAELPYDPTAASSSANANDFLLDFVDVPTPYDGDHNIAILPSPNPLLVLKRHAVYGIFGSFGGLSVDLIADGIGCIDIRSAQSYDEGQFWAGETGIFWYTGGRIVDLTAGKINREWRELTRDFDYGTSDYCSLALASGHLIVHITTNGGQTQRTYLCDLRDQSWQSRISNFDVRYMFTSRIPGEAEKLLAVSDDRQGRVLDFAPALDGSGTADDDAGSAPRLQAYTTTGLGRANGIEGITRLVDLDVHTNVYDAGAAGSTNMNVSVVSGGGTTNAADSTKTLTDIQSDTTDNVRRTSYRVAKSGRTHQVRFDVDAVGTDTTATKVEIHEIVATLRDGRERA